MSNKLSLIVISGLISSLISCSRGDKTEIQDISSIDDERYEEFVKGNCIRDDFSQGSNDNVYGLECIEGKHLLIKTSKEGALVSTSAVSNMETGLKLSDDVNFKNKFYIPNSYTILEGKADDKDVPFLLNFLPKDEEFRGALDTEYRIIFKSMGNRLVLFKAVENLDDLPDIEWTSAQIFRDGEIIGYEAKSYKKEEGDYYAIPFIGYNFLYCKAESLEDKNDIKTKKSRLNCEDSHLQDGDYIKLKLETKEVFDPLLDSKKDLFPSDYFDGLWYFSYSAIEANTPEGEVFDNYRKAWLVMMEKEGDLLTLKDMSGDVEYRNRKARLKLPVKWLDFELAQNGNGHWEVFGEREKKSSDKVKRPYAQIDFNYIPGGKFLELIVEPNYFSVIHEITQKDGSAIKWKSSFLKVQGPSSDCSNKKDEAKCLKVKLADKEKFAPRKWFKEDHKHVFGIMPTVPQDESQRGETTETERFDHYRMIRFNTQLTDEEEKRAKTKVIKWYFSKNSTKDSEYRELAEKAVEIYDQAFRHLTKNRDEKIRVELIKGEEKDLGDLRHNIINLVKTKDIVRRGNYILFGVAPSNANPDTGQIIGATANIVIHNQEGVFDKKVRDYIRYEVFQKDKRTDAENKIHAVSPYLRSQIQERCPEVKKAIKDIKNIKGLYPRAELNDRDIIISCGEKLTKQSILSLILHEMGHNFGLAHNFQASVDHENYYETEEEIRAVFPQIDSMEDLAHSSSVMDYLKLDQLAMNYLGKYDLAALRYLYLDELELKDGSFKDLKIPVALKSQKALSEDLLKERKKYLHCSDEDLNSPQIMMCDDRDYGSNPKEIVQEHILSIRRDFNKSRYRYDLDPILFSSILPSVNLRPNTHKNELSYLGDYYDKWLKLRNDYLIRIGADPVVYLLGDQDAIDSYDTLIKEGLTNNEEYALYYPVRKEISDFMIELADLDEMKCHFTDLNSVGHVFSLEAIKNRLMYGDNLYVEDCQSPQVSEFFVKNDLVFTHQTGYEDFVSYYPQKSRKAKPDVMPISNITLNMMNMTPLYKGMSLEPDLLQKLILKIQQITLNSERNQNSSSINFNEMIRRDVFRTLTQTLRGAETEEILKEHKENIQTQIYKIGKGSGSFYEEVEKYIENLTGEELKKKLSTLQIPFLKTAYEEYIQFKISRPAEYHNLSFQDYLLSRPDTVNDITKKELIIPIKKESFSAQVINKYNENLEKIRELKGKPHSEVEGLYWTTLIQHQTNLKEYMLFQ